MNNLNSELNILQCAKKYIVDFDLVIISVHRTGDLELVERCDLYRYEWFDRVDNVSDETLLILVEEHQALQSELRSV